MTGSFDHHFHTVPGVPLYTLSQRRWVLSKVAAAVEESVRGVTLDLAISLATAKLAKLTMAMCDPGLGRYQPGKARLTKGLRVTLPCPWVVWEAPLRTPHHLPGNTPNQTKSSMSDPVLVPLKRSWKNFKVKLQSNFSRTPAFPFNHRLSLF